MEAPQELDRARAALPPPSPWLDLAAGGVAGAAGIAAGAPLDTVRVRQMSATGGGGGGARGGRGGVPPQKQGLGAALRALAAREGGAALFKGAAYPLSTAALQQAVVFAAERAAFRWLCPPDGGAAPSSAASSAAPDDGRRGVWPSFLAGCFAGAVQTPITSAVELLKIRQQLNGAPIGSRGHLPAAEVLRRVVVGEGALRGLSRGAGLTLLRDAPSYGVYFAAYALARDAADGACAKLAAAAAAEEGGGAVAGAPAWWLPLCPPPGGALVQLGAGGLAGVVAWASIIPVDVVKSRVQASPAVRIDDPRLRTAPATRAPGVGWAAVVRQAWREEGFSAFFRGAGATLSRAFLVNGVIFYVFEGCVALAAGGGGA